MSCGLCFQSLPSALGSGLLAAVPETILHSTLSQNKALVHSDSRGQTRHYIHEIIPEKEMFLSKEAFYVSTIPV